MLISEIEAQSGEQLEDALADYYESCARTQDHHDLEEWAGWFLRENNLDFCEFGNVFQTLQKIDSMY